MVQITQKIIVPSGRRPELAESLKIQGGSGASSNVVGIIFPQISTDLTDLPKSGGANAPLVPQFRRP